jgi:hypothetical protein
MLPESAKGPFYARGKFFYPYKPYSEAENTKKAQALTLNAHQTFSAWPTLVLCKLLNKLCVSQGIFQT